MSDTLAAPTVSTASRRAGPAALLVLEDGTTLHGTGFGAEGETFGEMVFNTGMTGYQETLTDPSYARQIVAMTAPHIGNTGINDEDPESRRIWVGGYVVREPARLASSWRAARDLDAELRTQGITGIAVRGTRALTRRLRERGAMRGAISTTESDPARLLERVLASPGMVGADLARTVTTPEPYTLSPPPGTPVRFRVAAVDLGIKASTPRSMAGLGCEVLVLPADTPASAILAAGPDGVFFSNGPGDPAAAGYAVEAMRGVLDAGLPVFGICLGSQILGRALGLATYKLRYGHRGVNQPVMDLATGRVQITSHNHGFAAALPGRDGGGQAAADPAGATDGTGGAARDDGGTVWAHVPDAAREPFGTPYGPAIVSHVNLNDGVVEGLRLLERPVFSVQYHPEAAPGPHDASPLFEEFCANMHGRSA
ncbi:MAG TPA: glutamine-hydrolyzing carbamoyl-phosphate synthase small subunit [Streptosporangiaceae bacterium]|nr:glutamine-hydrolyzing carbamoyl-phosphate synthase small subunit [Streptosporangiaceae bacterium]